MKLSTLAIGLGFLYAIPQLYGLYSPAGLAQKLRKFPRSELAGYVLMSLGTVWFLWNLQRESISDFAAYKKPMLAGFGAIGLLTCLYVKDFLAVRGWAVVTLLVAKLMLDTARWHDSNWRLLVAVWAYVWIILAMWFTISPWRLRDVLNWVASDLARLRLACAARLAFCLLVIALGLFVF